MDVLVVSAFYKIDSKRSLEIYMTRINLLIKNTKCKFLIFTNEDTLPHIPMREGIELRVLPIEDFYSNSFASNNEYEIMTKRYSTHTAENPVSSDLIKIYAEKHMFVNRAIDLYPNYSYYLWNDLGSLVGPDTNPYLASYPSISKIKQLNIGDKVCFSIRANVSLHEYSTGIPDKRIHLDTPIAGTIILGNKRAWRNFIPMYHRSFNQLKQNSGYWGNDEHVYFHMLCNNPEHITGVFTYGFKLPIPDIYQCHSWNMFGFLLSDLYTDPIIKFEPIRVVSGYPNISKALWGSNDRKIDVKSYFHNKKDNSRVYLDYTTFKEDPAPGRSKTLYIEYLDGRKQWADEYTYLDLNTPCK
jgi:hypothetical protein